MDSISLALRRVEGRGCAIPSKLAPCSTASASLVMSPNTTPPALIETRAPVMLPWTWPLIKTSLALTSPEGWGETKTTVPAFQFNEGEDLKGPVPIAVAAERDAAAQEGARTRLVVIGDSEFLIDGQLSNLGNRDFLLGGVFWLLEQEQRIGIGPKTLEALKLNLTGKQLSNILWLSLLGMPLLCGALGVGMWWLRRR